MTTVHIAAIPAENQQRCIRCCEVIQPEGVITRYAPGSFVAQRGEITFPVDRDALLRDERQCTRSGRGSRS